MKKSHIFAFSNMIFMNTYNSMYLDFEVLLVLRHHRYARVTKWTRLASLGEIRKSSQCFSHSVSINNICNACTQQVIHAQVGLAPERSEVRASPASRTFCLMYYFESDKLGD